MEYKTSFKQDLSHLFGDNFLCTDDLGSFEELDEFVQDLLEKKIQSLQSTDFQIITTALQNISNLVLQYPLQTTTFLYNSGIQPFLMNAFTQDNPDIIKAVFEILCHMIFYNHYDPLPLEFINALFPILDNPIFSLDTIRLITVVYSTQPEQKPTILSSCFPNVLITRERDNFNNFIQTRDIRSLVYLRVCVVSIRSLIEDNELTPTSIQQFIPELLQQIPTLIKPELELEDSYIIPLLELLEIIDNVDSNLILPVLENITGFITQCSRMAKFQKADLALHIIYRHKEFFDPAMAVNTIANLLNCKVLDSDTPYFLLRNYCDHADLIFSENIPNLLINIAISTSFKVRMRSIHAIHFMLLSIHSQEMISATAKPEFIQGLVELLESGLSENSLIAVLNLISIYAETLPEHAGLGDLLDRYLLDELSEISDPVNNFVSRIIEIVFE